MYKCINGNDILRLFSNNYSSIAIRPYRDVVHIKLRIK